MARQFGSYSPRVPLGATWEEGIILEDENGDPIDLDGYDMRAQFYTAMPLRDPDTGIATVAPIAEITSPDWYDPPPAWPVFEGGEVASPTTLGRINTRVEVGELWTFSPTNTRRRLFWSIILVNPDTGYVIPVVEGVASFKRARTI